IRAQTRADLAEEGRTAPEHPAFAVIDAMLETHQRAGKAAGGGFYDYPAGGRKQLWPGLKAAFPEAAEQPDPQQVRDRLLFIQAQTRADLAEEGRPAPEHPAFAVIDAMLETHQRAGKAAGGGFYDYPAGGRKQLWPGLKAAFPEAAEQPDPQEVRDRLLFIQA